ncbi:MAG TPA: T9SS type A sorting domain-containing protein, partial [Rubricoccaceae bacterium]|nr:T9SS type A sorting domain-containing protein [Rubricoccaceae bacterium]
DPRVQPPDPALSGLGGGLHVEDPAGSVVVLNSVVARNFPGLATAPGADCHGAILSLGHNVLTREGDCVASSADVLVDSAAVFAEVLGPLADNGGPTQTYALLAGSPAIDAATCSDTAGQPVTLDQRRYVRAAPCDVGAFEFGAAPSAAESPPPAPTLVLSVWPNPARAAATIGLMLPEAGHARVALYDVLGREAALIHDGPLAAGALALALDASPFPPGVYLVRVEAGGAALTRRLTVGR